MIKNLRLAYCGATGLMLGLAAGIALSNGIPPEVILGVMLIIAGGIACWQRSQT